MLKSLLLTSALALIWGSVCTQSADVHLYVSPSGSDSNDGRQPSSPVKSLQHAVDMLQINDIKGNTVYVELMKGYHDLTSTLNFHTNLGGYVMVRAYQGQEVHVSGGKRLSSNQFHPVSDSQVRQRLPEAARDKVLELDLTAAGITDIGTLRPYGFFYLWNAPLELFINGKPLRLAEWPNINFINIQSVPDGENGRRFTYDSAGRDRNWVKETEPWVYGWWYWSWADSSIPVTNIDPETHTITLGTESQFGIRPGHYDSDRSVKPADFSNQGGYFRVINMLCELDEPGEYYVDRSSKKLYVWPNTAQQTLTSSDIVYASMVNQCISINSNVQNLHFKDFTVENCRQFGFDIRHSKYLSFENMELKNTGSVGIYCYDDCQNVSIRASEFHDVGGGVRVSGGDRRTLTESGIVISHNHMWDYSRVGAIPGDAVHLEGVKVIVTHNHLHHGQYTAIRWSGNDHVITYNDIHHSCWNSSDCGAIHSGRDWTYRGNEIRYNHIHDTLRYHPGAEVRGIMLDDEYSSVLIEHNVFYHNEVHANIGGGRDNVIRYNVMYDAKSHSIQVDGRGLGSGGHNSSLMQSLQNSAYQSQLWRTKYPALANILNGNPEAPEGNQIYNNVFYNTLGIATIDYSGSGIDRADYYDVHNNFRAYKTTDFTDPDHGEFSLRCEASDWAQDTDFQTPISVKDVGPQVPTGPNYLRVNRPTPTPHATSAPRECDTSTMAPAKTAPQTSYLPDGSAPNTLYPDIPKEGCWFIVDHCPQHREAEGTHKDSIGTAAGTETGCLSRAGPQWRWCGSPSNGKVIAIYGPTGAMTFGADGCYFAEYGCTTNNPGFHRDTWAEQNVDAANDEHACLNRASGQWPWCGGNPDRPITSVYGPTGNFRSAGAGCWIKILSCPAHHDLEGYFYDAWGATNLGTDSSRAECFDRANYYWTRCGSDVQAPVTAFYRPNAANHTVP